MNNSERLLVKPFLRWAGGKTWLIKYQERLISKIDFNNYHEPFLGGAAFFLSINHQNISFLSDLNSDLIDTYVELRDHPERIIEILLTYQNSREFYYHIRGLKFDDPTERAARFIYLNQTSFNGIYRVNLNGEYNVPYGYRNKEFLDANNLKNVSLKLRKTSIFQADFDVIRENVKCKDLVFLDPPYTVSHNNNGFIKYNQKIFSLNDQYRLSELIEFIKRKGAFYILTNAGHPKIVEIFEKEDKRIELSRASLIGGKNAKRGSVKEYVFTNIKNIEL